MNRKLGDIYVPRAIPVGTKIWFGSKRYGYTVRASYDTCDGRLADDLVHEAKNLLHAVLKLAIAVAELEREGVIK